jgi:5-formyltetrahydrofolate cyclo-ligase
MKIEPTRKSLKSRLRKVIRSKRAGIEFSQRKRWDGTINQHIVEYSRQASSAMVAAYIAFDGEPDLMPALAMLENSGVRLALPVVQDTPDKAVITFRRWSISCEMQQNRYGIHEPVGTKDIVVPEIDLVLVPLVGWDKTGGRLGMGAGFYDRLFQPFAYLDRPLRMGVAYQMQNVDRVPSDPWDISLHGVFTENGLFTCEN